MSLHLVLGDLRKGIAKRLGGLLRLFALHSAERKRASGHSEKGQHAEHPIARLGPQIREEGDHLCHRLSSG